ncbi:MAG: FecR family protein [Acidobacteria bacterium]|nr:FecR family protein [Acidobacteriota bacterium]
MPQRILSEPVGTLRKVINEEGPATTGVARGVRLVREGKETTPELGMELREGDTLGTNGQTRIVLASTLGSEIFLGPDSEIKVRKGSVFLTRGRLFSKLRELFRLETRYVVAGVEGTEVDLSVDSGDVVSLAVLEGKVRVESRTERWSARSYGEGEYGVIRGEAEPSKRLLDPKARRSIQRWMVEFERPREQPGAGIAR